MEIILKVEGMSCCGCSNRIQNVLSDIDKVVSVIANYETGEVKVVALKDVDVSLLKTKIESLDFKVVS